MNDRVKRKRMKRVIAVLNQKGGVGKTTTVINLSSYLAKSAKKVLIIDLDPQGNATSGFGFDKLSLKNTIYNAIIGQQTYGKVVYQTSVKNLFIIPTNADLAGAEVQLVPVPNRETKLREFISKVPSEIDYVIIDCPPSLGLLSINALAAATDVIIPVQTEYYAMEGLSQLLQIIQRVQKSLNPTLQIMGVVMTMYDMRTILSQQVQAEIEKVFGDLVFKTVVPRNVRLAEAPSHGKPIADYDKWSKGAKAYKNLAKEVLSRD